MSIWHIIIREIRHRISGFVLGVISVVIAVGVLVGQVTLLRVHDVQTQRIVEDKEQNTREEMARLEDDYRIITKDMGFNLLILPATQSLDSYFASGFVGDSMPEEYVHQLAEADLMTVQHLLPSLERQTVWPEADNRSVILTGTRGEVTVSHRNPKAPILDAVKQGTTVLGYQLWSSLGLEKGSQITFRGRTLTVADCHAERGTRDDITIWMNLAEVQDILDMKGEISGILALKCHCAGSDLSNIRTDVAKILPETRVVEFESKTLARARARDRAKAASDSALAAEIRYRDSLRAEKEGLAAWLTPLVLIGCILWVGLLALANVRERRSEIGIMRALGFRSSQILGVFLGRAALIGITGAVFGYIVGFVVVSASSGMFMMTTNIFLPIHLLLVLAITPLLAAVASWLPALVAVRQDPADVLREE